MATWLYRIGEAAARRPDCGDSHPGGAVPGRCQDYAEEAVGFR